MKITVDTDRMRAAGEEIRHVTGCLRENMDAVERLVNSLSGEWQGRTEKACAGRLLYVRREFKEIERFLEEYASLLGRFADEYQSCEEQLAEKIRNV